MPDDHSEVVPLLPIPNRTVKRLCADDIAGSRVKVGHRQAINCKANRAPKAKRPDHNWSGLLPNNSLTMSYFHTGIRTIIGAEAFHCPVRDGKEWDHLAMVIRLNW